MTVQSKISLADLHERQGDEIAVSAWIAIEQSRIDAFADCTNDYQWLHTDPTRARDEGPVGTTIAHDF